jgi:hypothetical protein
MANEIVGTKRAVSLRKRRKFLEVLAQTGSVVKAAQAVGYTDTSYLQRIRREDEDFAHEWALAVEAAADVFEAEADRRALDGVEDPVYYKGSVVGYKVVYSDALLMFRLRAMRPEKYAPRGGDTNVNVKFGIAVLPMTAPNAEDWEKSAVDVHANQTLIDLAPKPVEQPAGPAHRTARSD